MTVSAIVCSYWPNRLENVGKIVESMRSGTVVPDHIAVLNNNPDRRIESIDGADAVINAGFNYECRGKFIAAMLQYADYYVMADDDTALGPESLERWMYWATDEKVGGPEFCTGYWGVKLAGRSFMKGQIIQPAHLRRPTKVDAFHGRIMFMGHQAMLNMLRLEMGVRRKWPVEGDDLIAGIANPGSSWAVPMTEGAALIDLPDGGQAMQHADGYFAMRDRFCDDVLSAAEQMGIR